MPADMKEDFENFTTRLIRAMEDGLVKMIRDGGFVMPDYANRLRIDPSVMKRIYDKIDLSRVVDRVAVLAEEHMATKILHNMAQEVSTDVKQILSNTELREDLRAIIRARIRESAALLGKVKS